MSARKVQTFQSAVPTDFMIMHSGMPEPKQRAHFRPKVPPAVRPPIFMADMAGGLAAGSFNHLAVLFAERKSFI